jgi:hypothetical protein
MGSGSIDPCILDLGTSWRWVVSFKHQPLYPRRNSPRQPLDRRLGGPRTALDDAVKIRISPLPALKLRTFGRLYHSQPLHRLCYPSSAMWGYELDSSGTRYGSVAVPFGYRIKHSGSVRGVESLDCSTDVSFRRGALLKKWRGEGVSYWVS